MSQIIVRNIPDRLYEALKHLADSNNRSVETEVRLMIARYIGSQEEDGVVSNSAASNSSPVE